MHSEFEDILGYMDPDSQTPNGLVQQLRGKSVCCQAQNLSLIPRTYMMEGENSTPYMHPGICIYIPIQINEM